MAHKASILLPIIPLLIGLYSCRQHNDPSYELSFTIPWPASPWGIAATHLPGDLELVLLNHGLWPVRDIPTDLRYSDTANFLHKDVYGSLEKCYLQPDIVRKLQKATHLLDSLKPGYQLLLLDCARPLSVQQKMWQIVRGTPSSKYVSPPNIHSHHNYGAAVDITIIDDHKVPLDMGCAFDTFDSIAQPRYEKIFFQRGALTEYQLQNRELLRHVMDKGGFHGILREWWHFNAYSLSFLKRTYNIII